MSEFVDPIKTSEVLSAVRIRQKAPAGHMHVIIAIDPKTHRELEVFAMIGKSGGIPAGNLEATCRMISLYLRIGGTLENVAEQLEGIGSNAAIPSKDGPIMSMGDALGRAIQEYLEAKQKYGLEAMLTGAVDFEVVEAKP